MGVTLIVGQVLVAKYHSWQSPQLGLNIRRLRITEITGGTTVLQQDCADALSVVVGPLLRANMTEHAEYRGLTMKIHGGTTVQDISIAGAGIGSIQGEALPAQVSGIITLKTDSAGRAGRGRMYIPFPSEEDSDQAFGPMAGYMQGLVGIGAYHANEQSITIPGGSMKIRFGLYIPFGADFTKDFTGYNARQKWATQRRRGSYGRPNSLPF